VVGFVFQNAGTKLFRAEENSQKILALLKISCASGFLSAMELITHQLLIASIHGIPPAWLFYICCPQKKRFAK
jgi:hypothetical protein